MKTMRETEESMGIMELPLAEKRFRQRVMGKGQYKCKHDELRYECEEAQRLYREL